jgi:hypothetical protein
MASNNVFSFYAIWFILYRVSDTSQAALQADYMQIRALEKEGMFELL